MERTTLKKGIEEIVNKGFPNDKYCVLVIHTQNEVSYGLQNDVNFEYCKENGIPTYDLKRDGGAIVYFKGNVSWADVRPNNVEHFIYPNIDFLTKFTKYLKEKGLNAVQDNNDILMDGFKVASGCAINLPPDYKRTFSAVQICWKCDVETIQNICLKPMSKTPKGLYEYGIKQSEIINFVENYFTN